MSDEPLALSVIPPAMPLEGDYDAMCAAIMATARGRWFLEEYARRSRSADTALLLGAVERIERVIARDRARETQPDARIEPVNVEETAPTHADPAAILPVPSEAATDSPDVLAAAERLQDLAWTMRERRLDVSTCEQIEGLAAALLSATSLHDAADPRARKLSEVLRHLERRMAGMIAATSVEHEDPHDDDAASVEMIETVATSDAAGIDALEGAQPSLPSMNARAETIEPTEPHVDAEMGGSALPTSEFRPGESQLVVPGDEPETLTSTPADGAGEHAGKDDPSYAVPHAPLAARAASEFSAERILASVAVEFAADIEPAPMAQASGTHGDLDKPLGFVPTERIASAAPPHNVEATEAQTEAASITDVKDAERVPSMWGAPMVAAPLHLPAASDHKPALVLLAPESVPPVTITLPAADAGSVTAMPDLEDELFAIVEPFVAPRPAPPIPMASLPIQKPDRPPAPKPMARATPSNPFAALNAMSDDERIAVFT